MIAIRKSLDSVCIHKGTLAETIFVKIIRKDRPPVVVACAYRPPDNNTDISEAISRDITEIGAKFKKSEFMMGRDFNLPDIDWETSEIKGGRYSKTVNQSSLTHATTTGSVKPSPNLPGRTKPPA